MFNGLFSAFFLIAETGIIINQDCHSVYIYIDSEEGHLLIEKFVIIFFVTSLSVSLHNLLDFYNLFCLCCIVMSRRSVTH